MEGKEAFDPTRPCPKCGHRHVSTGYCGPGQRHGLCPFEGEHLHRHCQRCRYEWFERPLDQEPAPTAELQRTLVLAIANLEMGFRRAEFNAGGFHIVAQLLGSAQVIVFVKGVLEEQQLQITVPGQPAP